MEEIKLVLYGNPMSTQHLYGHTRNIRYMKKEAKIRKRSYKEDIIEQYKGDVINVPVEIDIKLYFGDRRKRDFDNFHKISLDALNGLVLEDDDLIMKGTIEKFYDKENPRIEFVIREYGV